MMENESECKLQNFEEPAWVPPIYSPWRFKTLSNKVKHPGNTDQRFLERLLYLHTEVGDLVVDPMCGGGSTGDVCKKRGRDFLLFDLNPKTESEHDIQQHDITTGLPDLKEKDWKRVRMVYMDPPYFHQAQGYYDGENDLTKLELDDFHDTLANIINSFAEKMTKGYIAMIIAPTTQKPTLLDGEYHDHLFEIRKQVDLKVVRIISCPYMTSQRTPQEVDIARDNKLILTLERDLIVWSV